MTALTEKKCVACEGDVPPLNSVEADVLLKQVPGWKSNTEATVISRMFTFKNFSEALAFVNKVGAIAEEEGHHPDIEFGWGRVRITLTTHAIKGLSENDFIVAAKINGLTM
jgi:4a-hydroxytetrahydrobiopterin dehydratase